MLASCLHVAGLNDTLLAFGIESTNKPFSVMGGK